MEAIKKLIYDIPTMTTGTVFDLGNYSRWNKVGITIEWSGMDKTDAVASFMIKNNSSVSAWETIPILQYTIPSASGTETLEHREFANAHVGIKIAEGTNTTGVITIWVFQKD